VRKIVLQMMTTLNGRLVDEIPLLHVPSRVARRVVVLAITGATYAAAARRRRFRKWRSRIAVFATSGARRSATQQLLGAADVARAAPHLRVEPSGWCRSTMAAYVLRSLGRRR
jgi:hypothetical protein